MMKRLTVLPGVIIVVIALTWVMAAQKADTAKQQAAKTQVTKPYTVVDEARRILKDVEEQAYDVTDHAGTLQAGTRLGSSREFNATELNALHDDVNGIGKKMALLEALAPKEASWERDTVNRVMPLLKQVAETTSQAIRYLDSKPVDFAPMDYAKITTKLYDQSSALWNELHDSVKLADLREREARLKKALAASGKTSK